MKSIIREKQLLQVLGFSKSTLRRKCEAGDFPKPIRLGANSVGWYEDEVAAWIECRERCVSSVHARNT